LTFQKTHAHRKLIDDVLQEVKTRRYLELLEVFRTEALKLNTAQIGQHQTVLLEGVSIMSYTVFRLPNIEYTLPGSHMGRARSSPIWNLVAGYIPYKVT